MLPDLRRRRPATAAGAGEEDDGAGAGEEDDAAGADNPASASQGPGNGEAEEADDALPEPAGKKGGRMGKAART